MTFETLLFIHKLLKEEEDSTRHAYESRRDYVEELKDRRSNREEIADAQKIMESADRIHTRALIALNEFNDHEWR